VISNVVPNMGSPAKKSLPAMLKLQALDIVERYHVSGGIGPDAYSNAPSLHPMAEAKFMLSLVALLNAKVISQQRFVEYAAPVCLRLEASRISLFGGGAAWGLGFRYGDFSAKEPFLITSALVVEALSAALATSLLDKKVASLQKAGMRTLTSWLRHWTLAYPGTELMLPRYSEHLHDPIINAAAYAMGVVARSTDVAESETASAKEGLLLIAGLRVKGAGWPYSASSGIVDLLHQCYIINAYPTDMWPADNDWHTDLISLFDGGICYLDVCTLVTESFAPSRELPIIRKIGDYCLRVERKPARLWSLGELLLCLSRRGRLIADEPERLRWKRTADRVARHVMEQFESNSEESGFVRHAMHGLHGIVELLAFHREDAQVKGNRASHDK